MFKVLWDNGHASGTFKDDFTTRKDAEAFGSEWKREMVAAEPTEKGKREARSAYQWEVIDKKKE
jgi:hypothetical protein